MRKAVTILVLTLFPGCMGQSVHQQLSNASREEYTKSECAKWLAVPSTADHFTASTCFEFDANYRFMKYTVGETGPCLTDLISHSLELQPRETNETFILVENASITLDGLQSVFGDFSSVAPTWWKTDLSRFDRQSFCAWHDSNHYGYGYIYLFDSETQELRSFQWSQQHNTVAQTQEALQ